VYVSTVTRVQQPELANGLNGATFAVSRNGTHRNRQQASRNVERGSAIGEHARRRMSKLCVYELTMLNASLKLTVLKDELSSLVDSTVTVHDASNAQLGLNDRNVDVWVETRTLNIF
jgi:hypothetical protein